MCRVYLLTYLKTLRLLASCVSVVLMHYEVHVGALTAYGTYINGHTCS